MATMVTAKTRIFRSRQHSQRQEGDVHQRIALFSCSQLKDVLYRHPEVQKAWFTFRDERIAMRMKRWFEYHDIEVNFV